MTHTTRFIGLCGIASLCSCLTEDIEDQIGLIQHTSQKSGKGSDYRYWYAAPTEPPAKSPANYEYKDSKASLVDTNGSSDSFQKGMSVYHLDWINGTTGKCLNFLHIPKNAGSSIEDISIQLKKGKSELGWGSQDWSLRNCTENVGGSMCTVLGTPGYCNAWHLPPNHDPKLLEHYTNNGCGTFCVVRNPIKRMISQYIYTRNPCSADGFVLWADKQFKRLSGSNGSLYVDDCHFVKQVEFVFGWEPWRTGQGGKICQHVLHIENLDSEFEALMEEYGIDLHLSQQRSNKFHSKSCNIVVPEGLQRTIEEFYRDDFDAFGYKRLFHTDKPAKAV